MSYESYTCNDEQTALFVAVKKGNVEIVKLLLNNDKIDVNIFNSLVQKECKKTALYEAVERENIDIVKLLMSNDKIDANALNKDCVKKYSNEYDDDYYFVVKIEETALHLAVKKENLEILNILMSYKNIDINIKNGNGKSPIDVTSNKVLKQIIKAKMQ